MILSLTRRAQCHLSCLLICASQLDSTLVRAEKASGLYRRLRFPAARASGLWVATCLGTSSHSRQQVLPSTPSLVTAAMASGLFRRKLASLPLERPPAPLGSVHSPTACPWLVILWILSLSRCLLRYLSCLSLSLTLIAPDHLYHAVLGSAANLASQQTPPPHRLHSDNNFLS